jgi:hypothetical protein
VVFAVWHADAASVYSDESVEIQPGVHVMIRTLCSSGSMLTECTTQLFLDQTLINALTTSVSPYSSRGLPDTTSAEDSIYSSSTQLTLTSPPPAAVMLRP